MKIKKSKHDVAAEKSSSSRSGCLKEADASARYVSFAVSEKLAGCDVFTETVGFFPFSVNTLMQVRVCSHAHTHTDTGCWKRVDKHTYSATGICVLVCLDVRCDDSRFSRRIVKTRWLD